MFTPTSRSLNCPCRKDRRHQAAELRGRALERSLVHGREDSSPLILATAREEVEVKKTDGSSEPVVPRASDPVEVRAVVVQMLMIM